MKKIVDIDERFLESARAALAEKMPWEKNITTKQTVNAALSFLSEKAARAWCNEIGIDFEPKKMEF